MGLRREACARLKSTWSLVPQLAKDRLAALFELAGALLIHRLQFILMPFDLGFWLQMTSEIMQTTRQPYGHCRWEPLLSLILELTLRNSQYKSSCCHPARLHLAAAQTTYTFEGTVSSSGSSESSSTCSSLVTGHRYPRFLRLRAIFSQGRFVPSSFSLTRTERQLCLDSTHEVGKLSQTCRSAVLLLSLHADVQFLQGCSCSC